MPAKGASHGDCVGGVYEVLWDAGFSRTFWVAASMLGVVMAGGFAETKLIMRARDGAIC